jgi:hypothetical protein
MTFRPRAEPERAFRGASGPAASAIPAAAPLATPAVAATIPAAAIAASPSAASPATREFGRRRRPRRHVGRIDHNVASRLEPFALAPQRRFVPQRHVQNPPFATVHRVEPERLAGAFHALGCLLSAGAQLFDAQHPVVVGVEDDAVMVLAGQMERFLGEMFEREQYFGLVRKQVADILAGELTRISGFSNSG